MQINASHPPLLRYTITDRRVCRVLNPRTAAADTFVPPDIRETGSAPKGQSRFGHATWTFLEASVQWSERRRSGDSRPSLPDDRSGVFHTVDHGRYLAPVNPPFCSRDHLRSSVDFRALRGPSGQSSAV